MSHEKPQAKTATGRSSVLLAVCCVGMLWIPLMIPASDAQEMLSDSLFGPYDSILKASPQAVSGLNTSIIFPSPDLVGFQNRSSLATSILVRLGLSPDITEPPGYSPDASNLVWRKPPGSEYFDGFLMGYTVVSYANDQGVLTNLYYSNNVNDGLLLAADVHLSGNLGLGFTPPFAAASVSLGESLGIPLNSTSSITFVNTSRTCEVVFSSDVNGTELIGCNLAAFGFNSTTGELTRVQFMPFLEGFDADAMISTESARTIAAESARSKTLDDKDVLVQDRVTGLRYLVRQTSAPSGNNTSASSDSELKMAYEYQADFRSLEWGGVRFTVMVLVDSETSSVWLLTRSPLPAAPAEPGLIDIGWFGFALAFTLVVVVVLVIASPEFAWIVLELAVSLLFVRLRGARILDNFNRGRIMGYISAKPGTSFTDIRDSLKMANGGLAYHLSVLERLELVTSTKVGRARRFFPVGVSILGRENEFLGATESKILDQLEKTGPLSNTALADCLKMSRQRVHYNLRLLERRGLVDRQGSLWQATPVHLGESVAEESASRASRTD